MSNTEYKSVLFMIEGGKALEMVKKFSSEVDRVQAQSIALCELLGVRRVSRAFDSGVILGVIFPAGVKAPEGWTKPNSKGISRPKSGSEWAKMFAAQKGHESAQKMICDAFKVPTSVEYKGKKGGPHEGTTGMRVIGPMFEAAGFLTMGPKGPHAMWIPDVAAEVIQTKKDGWDVGREAKNFKMEIPGCRRILNEEWDLIVAKHALAEARKETAQKAKASVASSAKPAKKPAKPAAPAR